MLEIANLVIVMYFTLEELCKSDTAVENKIQNIPSFEIVENLEELAMFLDGIREEWNSPILVTSGFRNAILNKKVKGSPTSAHLLGYAADLFPSNGNFNLFKRFVVEYLKDKEYDQCILERDGKTEWLHLGLYNQEHQQRKMCFKIEK